MMEKDTENLENTLKSTHLKDFRAYCDENRESMVTDTNTFSEYLKEILRNRKMTQQRVFLEADIPERYGYKLLTGEKKTRQRDVILRICYAAKMTLAETQRALKKYGMPELYAKIPRDALLMIAFNERPGSIIDVNMYLNKNGMDSLRTSGLQD